MSQTIAPILVLGDTALLFFLLCIQLWYLIFSSVEHRFGFPRFAIAIKILLATCLLRLASPNIPHFHGRARNVLVCYVSYNFLYLSSY